MEQDLYGLQASGIDPEIAAQMLGLKRKRAVADALMQQAMSPLKAQATPQGGYAVPISPWEGIAQLAKAYIGSKSLEDLDKQQGDLSKQNQAKVADAVASYEQTKNGIPASVAPVSDAGPGDAVDTSTDLNIPGKKGDPRAAIVQALSSPLLQNNPLVKMDMDALKPRVLGRTLVDGAGNTLATDSTWAEEQRANQEARLAQSKAAMEAKAAEAAAQRQSKEDLVRLAASLRPQTAPSYAEVIDPKDPTRLLKIDGKLYNGGSLGDAGVVGIAGKEPTAAKRSEQVDTGRSTVTDLVDTLRGHYGSLKDRGAIVDTEGGVASNMKARLAASGVGQFVGNAAGTEEQSVRNSIKQTRPLLMNAIRQATGMSAKSLDSNAELKFYLDAATNPEMDVQTNLRALDSLDKLYGLSKGAAPASNSATGQIKKSISSDAEYNALPSGATFVGPDGKTRRKP